jgi:benzoyl-CoA-dihydrodiol lyase
MPERQVSFDRRPQEYRHWTLRVEGPIAWLVLDVDEAGGLVEGYELKLNSYDLGVDIELYDATQRLRFEHPQVRVVVLTSGKDRVFSAGANIRMLAGSPHHWKVNFCKFTNETRCAMEDAAEHSGQTYLAAVNGSCAGGGYELALACERILLVDDGSSTVALPEVPLLGVLPGTGGLTRLTDKRRVRRDLADAFATRSDGVKGRTALEWRLVDEVVPRRQFDEVVRARAEELASRGAAPAEEGIELPPLRREESPDGLTYEHVHAEYDRGRGLATMTVHGPGGPGPQSAAAVLEAGAGGWLLALTRELDDLILRLRTNEPELGTWAIRSEGSPQAVLDHEKAVFDNAGTDWLCNEIALYLKRTLKRLDVTSRSLVALIEPGGCFAGSLLELALACDRQYLLDDQETEDPATITLSAASFGPLPMANGLTRLEARFYGDDEHLKRVEGALGQALGPQQAVELGLVTAAPDELDWEDEVRLVLEARAALSPDACTGMEANLRFVGPETMESRIFGRLTAWQNWIFNRPNASGDDGALRRYGTGQRPVFDRKRV